MMIIAVIVNEQRTSNTFLLQNYDSVIYCPPKANTDDPVSLCPSLCLPCRLSVNLSLRLSVGLPACLFTTRSLWWRHNERDSVSNHQPHDCLLNRLFSRRSKKTSKLRVTGLCVGNSPGTGEFPAQMASYGENVSIWWRHHVYFVSRISPL